MDMGGMPQMSDEIPPMPQGDEMPQTDLQGGAKGSEEGDKEDLQTMAGKMSNIIQNGVDVDKDDVKAALNMIIAQAKKVLDGNDLKASADKLTNVADASSNDGEDAQDTNQEQQPAMEGRMRSKRAVTEIFNGLSDGSDAKKRPNDKLTNTEIGANNPWVSRRN